MRSSMARRYPIKKARSIRADRASVLAELEEGTRSLRGVLREPPVALQGCQIYRILEAAPGMGPETTKKVLQDAGVWPLQALYAVSKLKRRAILDELPERIK
jgi:hypothetical protein